jgi:hypothetical protein
MHLSFTYPNFKTALQPDLNGALFYWGLRGAEAANKKSGSRRRKKLPKKLPLRCKDHPKTDFFVQ